MLRILIQQENLYDYRLELLNKLGENHHLVVLTSNNQLAKKNYNFHVIEGRKIVIGKLTFNLGVLKLISSRFDKYILLPNLYYPLTILLFFLISKKKRILWGCDTKKKNLALKFRVLMMKLSRAIIQYNNEERDKLLNYKINFDKIFVANNTIYVPNAFHDAVTDKTSLVYVGRLQTRKKIQLLLKAFSKLNLSKKENIKIEIVGDGEVKESLMELSKSLDIDKSVIFYGKITDHDELKKIFSRAYAYVSPDAIGLGLQHSFAYGVPVVTSKDGFKGPEYYHLIDEINCVLWSEKDKSLENAIEQILIKDINKRISVNCYNYYRESLSIDNMFNNFIKAIQH